LMDVSNGRFEGKHDLGDGYTRWDWHVHYGINNYDVALNIGDYEHFGGKHGLTTLDYYVLPADLDKAKKQFAQVPGMLDAYEHYFGEYPFDKDGYKLVEVPYAGMEHQSAVAYGNQFENGYLKRDWTGVGISPRFDFIIIHESGHEWFGNAVTAADRSDMWIHEGWTTYLEMLYVEYRWGRADSLKYANGLKPKVKNQRPIIGERGTNIEPPQDMYFKGALMLNTLRSVINNDAKWFADIHDFFQHFKYRQIMTEDVEQWWNVRTGMNLTPFFDEYLRHADLPVLELKFDAVKGTVDYRWKADKAGFAMPIKVGDADHWTLVKPVTTEWKTMPWAKSKDDFAVATDLYYVNVVKE
jgi:aminopeptidase N